MNEEDKLDLLEALEAIEEAQEEGGVISWEEFEAELAPILGPEREANESF